MLQDEMHQRCFAHSRESFTTSPQELTDEPLRSGVHGPPDCGDHAHLRSFALAVRRTTVHSYPLATLQDLSTGLQTVFTVLDHHHLLALAYILWMLSL